MIHAMIHALIALVACSQAASPTSETRPGTARLAMEPETLTLVDGSSVAFDRGFLRVPIVRADADSKEIAIEIYRFHAEEGAPQDVPPVVQLHGGPGWGGLGPTLARRGGYESAVRPFTRLTDLIVVGQRGIGSSTDTHCPDAEAASGRRPTPEESDAATQAACTACREHWEGQGYDLRGFNVIEAAADVDDVRRLLGYDQITLWGGSFGSHWGMTVMRYHGEHVARAVLTGMEGPDHTYDMPSGVLGSLERMALAAETSPEWLDHAPPDGLIEGLREVIAIVAEEPVELEALNPSSGEMETVVFDADTLRALTQGYTNRVSSRGGMPTWPADMLALYRGEFERAAGAVLANGLNRGLPTASFFMLDCGSGITERRHAELVSDPAAEVVGALGHWYDVACAMWDADLGDDFRTGFETDIPTVIVHGTWDVNTPFDNAVELVPAFTNSIFVVVEGGSHGALNEALGSSESFAAALDDFVVSGSMEGLPEVVQLPPLNWAPPHGD